MTHRRSNRSMYLAAASACLAACAGSAAMQAPPANTGAAGPASGGYRGAMTAPAASGGGEAEGGGASASSEAAPSVAVAMPTAAAPGLMAPPPAPPPSTTAAVAPSAPAGRAAPATAASGPATPAATAPSPGATMASGSVQQVAAAPAPVQPAAGILTAASVGDSDRRDNYLDYLARHPGEYATLELDMTRRLRVRVVDEHQRPVNAANVHVRLHGAREVVGRTHADGTWDFYPGVAAPNAHGVAQLAVDFGRAQSVASVAIPAHGDAQDLVVTLAGAAAHAPQTIDLGFAIDVTGSMGDELRYVNREIASIVERIEHGAPNTTVRVGATFYRDRSDAVPLAQIPFTTDVAAFAQRMQSIAASGGGDYPEDMNLGLDAALNRMDWSRGDAEHVLVLIADAPPQHYADEQFTYRHAMLSASQRGIRILPVAASGSNREVEYLFRALGSYTSTPYVYLTDDSHVGGAHMEADTDRVAIERFNDLLVRMVLADLAGHGMHEPGRLGPNS